MLKHTDACAGTCALRAKIAVDAGTTFEKYTYLTNDLLQPLTTRKPAV